MGKKININRKLNILNLLISIFVFGTGLILFTQFHIGDGAHKEEWLGLGKKIMADHSPGVGDWVFSRACGSPSDALEIHQDSGKAVANKSTPKNKIKDSRTNSAVHCHDSCIVCRVLPLDHNAGSNVGGRGVS